MQRQPKWIIQFEEARQARTPGIILTGNTNDLVYVDDQSIPPCLVKIYLGQYLQRLGYEVFYFSLSHGLQHLPNPNGNRLRSEIIQKIANPRDVEQVLSAFTPVLRRRDIKVALIVDYADHLCPVSQGMNAVLAPQHLFALQTFHAWGVDDEIRVSDNIIVLISHENQVNELLTGTGSGFQVITVDLPSEEERLTFVNLLLGLRTRGRAKEFAPLSADLTPQEFARVSGGLRLRDIEALFRQAQARGEQNEIGVTRQLVREYKAIVIRQLAKDRLEVKEPEVGFEAVAGLKHAVDYFRRLTWRLHSGATDVPQGILLAGVPGCGKSFLVSALAKELNYPCLIMRNIRERWVGASERNLEEVLWIAENLAPCLIVIEEIDQVLGQRTTGESLDAGTSERLLARIWEFTGSMRHRGRILWIATTNRPDLLDPAILDRFQVAIPFIHPSPSEIEEILPLLAQQLSRSLAEDVRIHEIANLPNINLPTVRGLQEIVAKAGEIADWEAGRVGVPIHHHHLLKAASLYKPNHNPILHEFVALTALRMTTFQDLLPWRDDNGWREGYTLPSYLEELVTPEGDLDIIKLNERLQQLQQQLQWERFARQV
jgi:SpoVK/Ycf46/Vps4 family AAA+-type ATPase